MRQAEALREWTAAYRGPMVLCGDLNTPPRGITFATLTSHWTDAFDACGEGFGYTWNTRTPVMRIDHILLGNGARALTVEVVPTAASDHRPIVATVVISR